MQNIKEKVNQLPAKPGVYIFKDETGQILYIGKATNLRSRASSYFSSGAKIMRPIEAMIGRITDIAVQKTDSVLEALILESNLIKKYQPKYNAIGKDDKSFSYILLTKEEFPRFVVLRETDLDRIQNSKSKIKNCNSKFKIDKIAKAFGPYTSKKQMEIALNILQKIFPYHSSPQKNEKNCFNFQIGKCPGPYAGAISREDYLKNIHSIKMILEGRKKGLIKRLEKEMQKYAKDHEFEKAAEIRNKIFALKHIQDVALISLENEQKSIENKIRIYGFDLSVYSIDANENILTKILNEKLADGVIVITIPVPPDLIKEYDKKNIPLVLIEETANNFANFAVILNNTKAGYSATEHLIKKGAKKIALLSGPIEREYAFQRYNGFLFALKNFNSKYYPNLTYQFKNHSFKDGIDAFHYLKNKKFIQLLKMPTKVF